jgi:hypothetical protein
MISKLSFWAKQQHYHPEAELVLGVLKKLLPVFKQTTDGLCRQAVEWVAFSQL